MHRGHQHGPAGQLQALPPLQTASLGPSLPTRQSHPYMFGAGPPSVFQNQHGPHAVTQAQRAPPALPVLPSSLLPMSGPGQTAVAPSSTPAPRTAFGPAPHVHDQTNVHVSQSMGQHAQNPPYHGPKISQYRGPQQDHSMPQQGQIVPQHDHSMPGHIHSRSQQGHSLPQHDHSVTQPGQQASQDMPQPAANEIQTQHNEGTHMQQPQLASVPQVSSKPPVLAKPFTSNMYVLENALAGGMHSMMALLLTSNPVQG